MQHFTALLTLSPKYTVLLCPVDEPHPSVSPRGLKQMLNISQQPTQDLQQPVLG